MSPPIMATPSARLAHEIEIYRLDAIIGIARGLWEGDGSQKFVRMEEKSTGGHNVLRCPGDDQCPKMI